MSEARFTPGPWKTLAGDWDKDCDGFCRYTISPLKELNASDARLIAAAPELYEALKLAKKVISGMSNLEYIKASDYQREREQINAALAKAEGRR